MKHVQVAAFVAMFAMCAILVGCAEQHTVAEAGKAAGPSSRGDVEEIGLSSKSWIVEIGPKLFSVDRPSPGKCVITIGGKALSAETHAIVVPEKMTPQEAHAAEELQEHLRLLTRQSIPILRDTQAGGRNVIVVGRSELLKKLKVDVDWDSLGTDGIVIRTVGANLVLAGNTRGVLYACHTFLEDYLGVRWFTPLCTVLPKEGVFDLAGIDKTYVPPLQFREPHAFIARNRDWAVRNKYNGYRGPYGEAWGGKLRYARMGFVHTFHNLVPSDQYFKDHPEYFAEVNGQRQKGGAQLCLTNPAVMEIAAQSAMRLLRADPQAQIVSVSQNDNSNYCRCAKCKAVDAAEGSPSGTLLRFVNHVAERVEKEFPDVLVSTLAYQYSRKPPKLTRPRRNVAVRLCSIECSFSQPLSGSQNEAFRRDLEGWGKICNNLHIWDYVVNFKHYIQPHPNLRVLKPNIQLFVANGVKSVFEQGVGWDQSTEFQELRTWLLAKLLWDPEADADKLMNVFLEGYYGPAAGPIRKYIDLIHDAAEKSDVYMGMNYDPINSPFLTPEILARSQSLFDLAEHAVRDTPTLLTRVRTARLPLLYVQIQNNGYCYEEAGDTLMPIWKDNSEMIDRFERIARAAGATTLTEHRGDALRDMNEWATAMRRRPASFALTRLRNAELELTIAPALGGRIWRMRHLPAGRDNVLKPPDYIEPRKGSYWAHYGGYAEYIKHAGGVLDTYKVVRRDVRSIVLQADLSDGIRIDRRIELDAKKPVVRITSTLTNIGEAARTTGFRVFPSFGVADTQRASVWTKSPDGRWRRHRHEGTAKQEVWLRDGNLPAGEWALVDDTDNVGVVNRFQAEQVEACYLFWSGPAGRVYLQMYSPDVELKPGESVKIEHSYEMVRPASGLFGK